MVSAYGQRPAFEVASIKPSPPPSTPGMMRIGMQRAPGRVTYSGMSLKLLIQNAFRVKNYQISGPAWLDSERFEIVAKLPEGANADQTPEMMQKLLAERFGLKLHRETKELPVYALVTGKNGPKLEASRGRSRGSRSRKSRRWEHDAIRTWQVQGGPCKDERNRRYDFPLVEPAGYRRDTT